MRRGPALKGLSPVRGKLYMDYFNMLCLVLGQRYAQGTMGAQRYRTQFDLETGGGNNEGEHK